MSSTLSVGADYDLSSPGLREAAQSAGHWRHESGPVDFARAFSAAFQGLSLSSKQQPANRLAVGRALLQAKAKDGASVRASCWAWARTHEACIILRLFKIHCFCGSE